MMKSSVGSTVGSAGPGKRSAHSLTKDPMYGDRVRITTGKYAGHHGTVEANVYQRTVDYRDEWANGHHVMLDTEELVTVRWEQVEGVR